MWAATFASASGLNAIHYSLLVFSCCKPKTSKHKSQTLSPWPLFYLGYRAFLFLLSAFTNWEHSLKHQDVPHFMKIKHPAILGPYSCIAAISWELKLQRNWIWLSSEGYIHLYAHFWRPTESTFTPLSLQNHLPLTVKLGPGYIGDFPFIQGTCSPVYPSPHHSLMHFSNLASSVHLYYCLLRWHFNLSFSSSKTTMCPATGSA